MDMDVTAMSEAERLAFVQAMRQRRAAPAERKKANTRAKNIVTGKTKSNEDLLKGLT